MLRRNGRYGYGYGYADATTAAAGCCSHRPVPTLELGAKAGPG